MAFDARGAPRRAARSSRRFVTSNPGSKRDSVRHANAALEVVTGGPYAMDLESRSLTTRA